MFIYLLLTLLGGSLLLGADSLVAVSGVTPKLPAWAFHWGGFSLQSVASGVCLGFSVRGPWAQCSRPVGSSAGAVVPAMELRRGVCDLPGVPCIARWSLNHWITGEAVSWGFLVQGGRYH